MKTYSNWTIKETEWFKCDEALPPRDIDFEFSIDVLLWDGESFYVGYFEVDDIALDEHISDEIILKNGYGNWTSHDSSMEKVTHWTFLPKAPEN
jgi:hypothetical protein